MLSELTEETLSLDLSNQRIMDKDSLGITELDQSESSATEDSLSQEEEKTELWLSLTEVHQIKNSLTMDNSDLASKREFLHSQDSNQATQWFMLSSIKANHNKPSQLKSLTSEKLEDLSLSELPTLSLGNKSSDVTSRSYQEDQRSELEVSSPKQELEPSSASRRNSKAHNTPRNSTSKVRWQATKESSCQSKETDKTSSSRSKKESPTGEPGSSMTEELAH